MQPASWCRQPCKRSESPYRFRFSHEQNPTTPRYTGSESSFGVLQGDRALPSALEGKLMVEREHLYSQLVDVKEKMVRLVHLSCY